MPVPLTRTKLFALLITSSLVVSLLVLSLMAEFHEHIAHPFLTHLDLSLLAAFHAHTSPRLTRLARAFSFIGSPLLLVPTISCTALILWVRGLRRDAALLLIAIGGSGVMDIALKLHFHRTRPDVPWALATEHSFSFPSGHSVGAVVLYGVLTYLLWSHLNDLRRRVFVISAALLLIAGIGLSRVYLGVHFPTDVAAGYAVGLLWLLPVIAGNEFLNHEETPRRSTTHAPGSTSASPHQVSP